MRSLLRDAAYGFRLFRRNPAFSWLSVTIMALGIGAATSIFSLINGILLNPLPYRDAGRLAVIWSDFSRLGGNTKAFSSPADYFDWMERNRSFLPLAAYNNSSRTFTGLDQPLTPLTHEVTANFFDVLGVQASRGRTFVAGEDQPGRARVAIISDALWKSVFGGSDALIGSRVELDGESVTVVGVLPRGFRVPNNAITVQPDLWVPAPFESLRRERAQRALAIFGRLRPGVTMSQAQAELAAVSQQVARENGAAGTGPAASVRSVREDLTGEFRGTFLLLLGAVGIILLIACANVANLLLARYAARAREIALRSALGASRGQILRQLITESLILALAGGIAGVLLANWSVRPLLALVPESAGLPFANDVSMNLPVLTFALALSALTSILFGAAPARQTFGIGIFETLKSMGRSRAQGSGGTLWRNGLIVIEVGLSVVLLMGAGLMIQTFWRLSRVEWGFEPAGVLTVRNSLRGEAYATPEARRLYFEKAAAQLARIAGVESVSAVSFPPPLAPVAPARFARSDQAVEPGRDSTAITLSVLPRYFETLRTPILAGRSLSEADTADSARVVVVSQALARRYFADRDPVGQNIHMLGRNTPPWRIVGVAGDIRGTGLASTPQPVIFFPQAQAPVPVMTFLLRTHGEPMSVAKTAERTLWSLGRLMNVYQIGPLEQRVSETFWQSRFTMILLTVFAGLALVLATAGMYAVISYLASQRTQEIGIRMALGARPRDVLWMVTTQAVGVAAIGIVCGGLAALALSRVLATRVYGVTATDPWTLAAAAAVLLAVTAAAGAVPARRAARIDPLRALREE